MLDVYLKGKCEVSRVTYIFYVSIDLVFGNLLV
jgi:hypothetical protein